MVQDKDQKRAAFEVDRDRVTLHVWENKPGLEEGIYAFPAGEPDPRPGCPECGLPKGESMTGCSRCGRGEQCRGCNNWCWKCDW
jgi:hypothetical protein